MAESIDREIVWIEDCQARYGDSKLEREQKKLLGRTIVELSSVKNDLESATLALVPLEVHPDQTEDLIARDQGRSGFDRNFC
jgi:hypothetical protein